MLPRLDARIIACLKGEEMSIAELSKRTRYRIGAVGRALGQMAELGLVVSSRRPNEPHRGPNAKFRWVE